MCPEEGCSMATETSAVDDTARQLFGLEFRIQFQTNLHVLSYDYNMYPSAGSMDELQCVLIAERLSVR